MNALLFALLITMDTHGSGERVGQKEERAAQQAPSEKLRVEIHPTFGARGSVRPNRFLPGEKMHVRYTVAPLGTLPNGEIRFSATSELFDAKGASLGTAESKPEGKTSLEGETSLGGGVYTVDLELPLPGNLPSGWYHFVSHVDDRVTKRSGVGDMPFVVLPPETFGALDIRFALDPKGEYECGAVVAPGSYMRLVFSFSGFEIRDGRSGGIASVSDRASITWTNCYCSVYRFV